MFGTYKDNILSKLEEIHNSGNYSEFKKQFTEYAKVLVKNNTIRQLYHIYEEANRVRFEDPTIALEYVNDVLSEAKKLNVEDIRVLKKMITDNIIKLKESTIDYYLDKLIFDKKLPLSEGVLMKRSLSTMLCNKTTSVEYVENLTTLTENISSKMLEMNEDERNVLNLFIENNPDKIHHFYGDLIKETENLIEENILTATGEDIIKALINVKRKLNELKNNQPTINEITKILSLKQSL